MKKQRFGLIGHPIKHSLSPALFRAGYDGRYQYDLIETPDFEQAYERFIRGYDGVNVTAPFKELALAKADTVTEECRLVGATNLLIKTSEGITAYNSDYRGLCLWLSGISDGSTKSFGTGDEKGALSQRTDAPKVLVVGMGGAGKAAAAAAWSTGCRLTLMNRNMAKAEDMAAHLVREGRGNREERGNGAGRGYGIYKEGKEDNNRSQETGIEVRPMEDFLICFNEADIIIYNLPVRLPVLDALVDEEPASDGTAKQSKTRLLLEANYRNPSFDEEMLKIMGERYPGLQYTEGRTWLLLQAQTGYELFTGEKPDLSKMSAQI